MATARMLVMNSGRLFISRGNLTYLPTLIMVMTVSILIGCNKSTNDTESASKDAPAEEKMQTGEDSLDEFKLDDLSVDSQPPLLTITPASTSRSGGTEFKTASMKRQAGSSEDYSLPVSGTPEWDIRQIALLIAKEAHKTSSNQSRQQIPSLNIATDETARRIIALASHAISETHQRPEKELIFNAAIQSLMDARLKLAIAGEKESLDAIYEDAATIAKERPGSSASIIAAGTVVRLALEMAHASDSDSPWVSEYVRQVKLFATNFPQEEARAIVQLTSAGEFCEQRQLILPAIECYTMIQQQFPKSPFRKKADAALQRLGLIGKSISLESPTIDGGTFRLSEKKGKPIVLVFWSVRSSAFQQDIELLNRLVTEAGIHLVGINMDTDAEAVKQFIEANQLAGEHTFYPDFSLQGASQPLARQFGINVVPTYWYIDAQGRVRATNVSREQLNSLVSHQ